MNKYTKIAALTKLNTALIINNDLPTIYVSGKVTGLRTAEFREKFARASWKLRANGFNVLNPCDYIDAASEWTEAMRIGMAMLSMADAIYMLPCWTDSRGARAELETAKLLGLDVIFG
jgi:hypothetical protein